MLSKTHRFHGLNSLRGVYSHGQMARGPWFGIKAVVNQRRGSYRVAVVISRKVNKSAVARNRMRRRLYATVRELGLQINQPYDIVITVFNDKLIDAPAAELESQLKKQFQQLNILN